MKTKAAELKTLCDLNLAAVALKVDDFVETKSRCKKVLEKERTNVKALYRLAQADVGLKEYTSAMDGYAVLATDVADAEQDSPVRLPVAEDIPADWDARRIDITMRDTDSGRISEVQQ